MLYRITNGMTSRWKAHTRPDYSLDQFLTETAQKDRGEGLFELENSRMFEINLGGLVWIKVGSVIASGVT
ncbi:MAG TPA: hypothetical protein VK436_06260 [Methanocella sp.]|nr:hypothetical protein [Methanocella sp.]